MIATKFCDVCDVELPPMAFQNSYECADVQLHANHPNRSFTWVRLSTSPKRNKRDAAKLTAWREWRQVSRKNEIEREGCNKQHKI